MQHATTVRVGDRITNINEPAQELAELQAVETGAD